MPTYSQSLDGVPGNKDIIFGAAEINRMKSFGTADRYYPMCTEKEARKGRIPQYGIRTSPPWKFCNVELFNGKCWYRFTQDEMNDDPKWKAARMADVVFGEGTVNEYLEPEEIRERGGEPRRRRIEDFTDEEFEAVHEEALESTRREFAGRVTEREISVARTLLVDVSTAYRQMMQDEDVTALSGEEFGQRCIDIFDRAADNYPDLLTDDAVAALTGFMKAAAADYLQRCLEAAK